MQTDNLERAKKIAQQISYADLHKKSELSVEKLWLILASSLFKGKQVSDTQYKEMRKAFYCGFTECFRFFTDIATDLSEDDAANIMGQFAKELNKAHDDLLPEILGVKK